MAEMEAAEADVKRLYAAFDKHYPRPSSLYNERCCVKEADERPLLGLPRERLTEEMLARPADHFCGCFATFEQASYFVPRLMELLGLAEEGFEWGCLNISFFRFLRDHQEEYESRGLWALIEQSLSDILSLRISTFEIEHFDKAACEAKGWGLSYFDHVVGSEGVDSLLDEFFYPLLITRPTGSGRTEWDALFEQWADDGCPERIAHLLNVTKEGGGMQYVLPESYRKRLDDRQFAAALIKRAEPVVQAAGSPTWLPDLRRSLSWVE